MTRASGLQEAMTEGSIELAFSVPGTSEPGPSLALLWLQCPAPSGHWQACISLAASVSRQVAICSPRRMARGDRTTNKEL